MGVHRTERKASLTSIGVAFGLLLFVIVFTHYYYMSKGQSGPWWLGITGGLLIGWWATNQNIFLACPNCNTELAVP